jgi:molybdopterin molybdotransferase
MERSSYPLVDAEAAAAFVLERTSVLGGEDVHLAECAGRVLVRDLVAPSQLPPFPSSAVDGYALRAVDAGRRIPVAGESAAGRPFQGTLPPGSAATILTGGVVPDGADTVVMVEDVQRGDGWVAAPPGFPAGRNFHRPGDDVRPGDLVVPRGQPLGPAELGLAAAIGAPRLHVHRRPLAALMSTGDELVEVGEQPGPGQIVDSNRWALLAALREAGAQVTLLRRAPDQPGRLRDLVVEALVKPLLESLGEVHVGRVKLKPGKPFTFATLPGERVAFGLPGFPVSSLITFEVFVRPALRKMQGFAELQRPTLSVRLGYEARAPGDRTEYQRVRLVREGEELVAVSTGSQSSSRLASLAGAHALIRVPAGDRGIPAGDIVEALIISLPA